MKMRMGGTRLLIDWLGSSEKRKKKKDTERRIVYVQREHTSERTFRKL